MRVTISHQKTQQDAMRAVDQGLDDVFRSFGAAPIEITDEKRSWNGPVLTFSLTLRMGFLRSPIQGTVDVQGKQLIIDVDLGILGQLLPEKKMQTTLETKVRGLLT